jgi:hypothetical protein
MTNTSVRYHRGDGHLVNAAGRSVTVIYALEEWREANTGNTTILGSIEGPRGLISERRDEQFILVLTSSLTIRCTLRVMAVPTTYEVVPIGGFVQL